MFYGFSYLEIRSRFLHFHRVPSNTVCSGPLGCLSTARSDFDICWNTQWNVQAWKNIQRFDPKPLVPLFPPFPFYQNLLCDIVHWHVGSQNKGWIYLNLHQCKTIPSIINPSHVTDTQRYTKIQGQAKQKYGPERNCRSALSIRHQYFMSKPKIAKRKKKKRKTHNSNLWKRIKKRKVLFKYLCIPLK